MCVPFVKTVAGLRGLGLRFGKQTGPSSSLSVSICKLSFCFKKILHQLRAFCFQYALFNNRLGM